MKTLICFFLAFFTIAINAQDSEKSEVQKTVEAFFEAFHKKDSIAMNSFVGGEGVKLQSVFMDKEGKHHIRTEEFNGLVKSIVSIPDSVVFQEKLFDFNIQVDGLMANVWVPYEFWYNNEFSHCGVNCLQMFKDDDKKWKIIYLIDTRRRAGCLEK
ncbi:hypothetical protein GGR42_000068 [Saonia flava]|uniref:Nuclear transport factor 2 family protein n=1 Tax=Saonia flava TaxID=523696 RepID=A0A846QKX7_9FLAO|nr:nuclear transport factor 2 family protein [Saonia flava]NJB69606.1 hypothetical protein [Saonia flava]